MVRAYFASVLLLALPLAATPTAGDVCHPVQHHRAVHAHAAATHGTGGVGVVIDQARLVSFPEPVKTVYVGNSTIVDVSMVDPRHAFLLGKTFGVTNMIAMGPDGKQVSNQQVTVLNNFAAVTVNRGADQFDYMCTAAHCETAPRPGDSPTYVQTTESAATQHESSANAAGQSVQAQSAQN